MGDCGCNKNRQAPTGSTAARRQAEAAANDAAIQAARSANPSTSRIGPNKASGSTQTFALRTRDGQVERFGSALERNAERIRRGGDIV
ncbi:hypothetical protein [Microbacterium phage MO526]|uniref:Uncharacterized protein n=1 Tax=Microbacterium phage MO526 TaxID=3108092 RepID=A0ABZ1A0Y5_9CAUD|nr:hypothetical protein [Microbacterium phage MO526]